MKKNQDRIFEIIKALDKTGILDNLILIGSWAMFFYKEIFPNFIPSIRTIDLDFYVPRAKSVVEKTSTIGALRKIHYEVVNDTLTNRTTFISADGFELEFLTNLNRQRLDCIKIGNTEIYSESLPHLDIFTFNFVEIVHQGIKLKIASPSSFVLQKLLINEKRKNDKRQKDIEAIKIVLSHIISNREHLNELKSTFNQLNKSQRSRIIKIAENNAINLGLINF